MCCLSFPVSRIARARRPMHTLSPILFLSPISLSLLFYYYYYSAFVLFSFSSSYLPFFFFSVIIIIYTVIILSCCSLPLFVLFVRSSHSIRGSCVYSGAGRDGRLHRVCHITSVAVRLARSRSVALRCTEKERERKSNFFYFISYFISLERVRKSTCRCDMSTSPYVCACKVMPYPVVYIYKWRPLRCSICRL